MKTYHLLLFEIRGVAKPPASRKCLQLTAIFRLYLYPIISLYLSIWDRVERRKKKHPHQKKKKITKLLPFYFSEFKPN